MSQTSKSKATPARKGAKDKPTRAELRRRLALALSEVLANPETPSGLYRSMSDWIADYESAYLAAQKHNPDHIEKSLNAYIEREEKRKEGAR
jgi:hypothetical protein